MKTQRKTSQILPSGFRDLLFDEAEKEFEVVNTLLTCFLKNKFRLIKPALLEYEGQESANSFKIFDINEERNLVFRSDITKQIARIIEGSLISQKPPIKFCYSGQILRLKTQDLYKDRQITQLGIEVFDIESDKNSQILNVFKVLIEGLKKLKLKKITIDVSLPSYAKKLVEELNLSEEEKQSLSSAIKYKNLSELEGYAKIYNIVKLSVFKEDKAGKDIAKNPYISAIYTKLIDLQSSNIKFNFDLLDTLDYSYQTDIAFTIYAENGDRIEEIGRGGQYEVLNKTCFGFSLSVNNILRL